MARHLVQGLQGPERSRIIVTRRVALASGEAWTERDTELELAILRQVDTAAASTIWLEAQRSAEAQEATKRSR